MNQGFPVSGGLIVVMEAGNKEQAIVKQGSVIYHRGRPQEQAGAYVMFVLGKSGKQVQAPLYQIIVLKCFVIGQSLEP